MLNWICVSWKRNERCLRCCRTRLISTANNLIETIDAKKKRKHSSTRTAAAAGPDQTHGDPVTGAPPTPLLAAVLGGARLRLSRPSWLVGGNLLIRFLNSPGFFVLNEVDILEIIEIFLCELILFSQSSNAFGVWTGSEVWEDSSDMTSETTTTCWNWVHSWTIHWHDVFLPHFSAIRNFLVRLILNPLSSFASE